MITTFKVNSDNIRRPIFFNLKISNSPDLPNEINEPCDTDTKCFSHYLKCIVDQVDCVILKPGAEWDEKLLLWEWFANQLNTCDSSILSILRILSDCTIPNLGDPKFVLNLGESSTVTKKWIENWEKISQSPLIDMIPFDYNSKLTFRSMKCSVLPSSDIMKIHYMSIEATRNIYEDSYQKPMNDQMRLMQHLDTGSRFLILSGNPEEDKLQYQSGNPEEDKLQYQNEPKRMKQNEPSENSDIIAAAQWDISKPSLEDPVMRLFVLELIVNIKYRSQGYGKIMMQTLERIAQNLGCNRVDLIVQVTNFKAQKLYKKRGYVPVIGKTYNLVSSIRTNTLDELLLSKVI